MEHLLAPFKLIDLKIQAVVDAVAFFFMRRGVRKSFLTYSVYIVIILAILGTVWHDLMVHRFFSAVFSIFCIILLFRIQRLQYQFDELSESRGMLNLTGVYFGPFSLGLCKFLFAYTTIIFIFAGSKLGLPYKVYRIIYSAFYFLSFYLMMTPNRPSPQKKDVKIKQREPVCQSV